MRRFRHPMFKILFVLTIFAGQIFGQAINPQTRTNRQRIESQAPQGLRDLVGDIDLTKSPLSAKEQMLAGSISEKVKATEWLGALAPVAVSPFFGLT